MRLVSYAFAGVEPEVMGVGPVPATEKALAKAGLTIDDIGLFEINEAFAVQVLAFLDHFGIADDDPRVNPYGGAIALGHPLAASGRAADDAARPPVRGAPRGPLRPHHDVHRHRHGRHRHLGEPALDTATTRQVTIADQAPPRSFPDEVITTALVRYVDLPVGCRHAARWSPSTTATTTPSRTRFGPAGLADARRARSTTAYARPDVVAVGITGKPFILAVGADLKGVAARAPSASRASRSPGRATRCSRRLGDGPVPTFAFVNGAALGGGLEIALHCTYRTVSAAVPALRPARVLPRPGARLGRRLPAAEPRRRRTRPSRSSSRTR